MCKEMFIDICHEVASNNLYFVRRTNAAGVSQFSIVQKVTAALHMLAYGGDVDGLDSTSTWARAQYRRN